MIHLPSLRSSLFPHQQTMIHLRRIVLSVSVSGFLLLVNSGCNNCSPIFRDDAWGTWLLVRLDSPSGTQTVFPVKQTLKIALDADRYGNSFTGETLFSDDKPIDTKQWETTANSDCRNRSFTAVYDRTLQRKYSIADRSQTLLASGYVDQVGGKADTLKYYYKRVQ